MFSQAITSFVLLDRHYRFVRVNEAFASHFDLCKEDFPGRLFADLFLDPEGLARLDEVVRTKRTVAASQQVHRAVRFGDHAPTYWNWALAPILDDAGEVEFVLLSGVDITAQRRAEEKLRADETVYEAVFNAMNEGVVFRAANDTIIAVNPAAERIAGRTADEMQGRSSAAPEWRLVQEDGSPYPSDRLPPMAALHSGKPHTGAVGFSRPTGERVWVWMDSQPLIHPGEASPYAVVTTFHDITERNAADERRTLMVHELNHRVKNTLATVQSIAMQTLSTAVSSEAFREAFCDRLVALAQSHDLLTRNDWSGTRMRELVVEQLKPHHHPGSERIALGGPDIRLTPKTALALGMALFELATNAVKYGALSTDSGTVSVCWDRRMDEGRPRLRLIWREQGGPPVRPPTRRGFGSRLIERGLTYELGGLAQLTFEAEGVVCEIDFPLLEGAPWTEPPQPTPGASSANANPIVAPLMSPSAPSLPPTEP